MLDQPDLRPINSKEFVLYEDFTREWIDTDGRLCRQTTFRGYVTDIASTPDACALLGYKPDGLHRVAALLHDRRYQRLGQMAGDDILGIYEEFDFDLNRWVPIDRKLTREQCDQLFLQDMLDAGTNPGQAKRMFQAVRLFGWMAFK